MKQCTVPSQAQSAISASETRAIAPRIRTSKLRAKAPGPRHWLIRPKQQRVALHKSSKARSRPCISQPKREHPRQQICETVEVDNPAEPGHMDVSLCWLDTPVTLPPGRARLVTMHVPTGSPP